MSGIESKSVMRAVRRLVIVGAAGVLLCTGSTMAQDDGFELRSFSIEGGGGTLEEGDLRIRCTIGQPEATVQISGDLRLSGGFWKGGGEQGPSLLSGYAIIHGDYVSGSLDSLLGSDDDRLHISPRLATSLTLPVSGIEVHGQTTTTTPSQITVFVETSANALPNSPPQVISLYNFDADAWETIDERLGTFSDASIEVTVDVDPQRFVGPASAEMRMRVVWFDPGDVISSSWNAKTDQAIWQVDP